MTVRGLGGWAVPELHYVNRVPAPVDLSTSTTGRESHAPGICQPALLGSIRALSATNAATAITR